MRKTISILLVISVCLAVFLSSCSSKTDYGVLEITVLDIGKADAIILKTEYHTVLIDTGNDEDGDIIVQALNEQGVETIDHLIITHFDKDHVGGADTILRLMTVQNVIQPDYEEESNQYAGYLKALGKVGITPISLHETFSFTLDDISFDIYPSEKTQYDNVNNFSLVISVRHGEKSFLFAGDAMANRIKELLAMGNIKHDFLKVPHHGDFNKRSEAFFEAVSPAYAVITCSADIPASDETVAVLKQTGAEVYLTTNGSVTCISDGYSLEIYQKKADE